MKHTLLVFIAVLMFGQTGVTSAQGFTFRNLDPVYSWHPYIPDSIQVIKKRAIVTNTSSAPLNFRFARIVNNMPAGWYTQMCYDLCYAPFVDTISLPSDPPYNIAPGYSDTLFYIDFSCTGPGTGNAIVRMYNTSNPSAFVQDTFIVQVGGVGVNNISSLAEGYELGQNFPNPFNPSTKIKFAVPVAENVRLSVFDVSGKLISYLLNGQRLTPGTYEADFDASGLAAGVYYYKIEAGDFVSTKKMLLVK